MKNKDYFIRKYLENRPMFLAIIRSQEAVLFQKHNYVIKGKVLDFGCGDGFFTEIVFGKGKIDVGLDLKNSRALRADENKTYKKVVYYDGKKIPFPDKYFSTVISNCVLEHIPNLKQSLSEIKRVLKPKGFFLTSVMTDRWEDYLFGKNIIGNKYLQIMRKRQEHYNLLSSKQWNSIFEKTGFKIIKTDDYMNKKQSQIMDLFHYLSLPSLISHKFTNKWVLFPKWYKYLFMDKYIDNLLLERKIKEGSAQFYLLKV
ncbi:MAG: hypothetical protein US40_C0010G0030 [Candidatus Roizmanbacteria bacterium GW2011_GWC2_37_13]|uniref:Methyltransferase type 11 domain-containing protein n=1 Tax=Candidatus Roizmanbacteria bacterium GW2011_GWC2_37_13 TaxID=1618486 RepID=A0A0G0G5D8_9BACT|nr:MAG: hypothetical protein US38_C0011G0011 [Candidatus Roizmanbacteria bacterium GW2011_GWC1_37_12]KKQ25247.1 MAG: hypothetical protein US40_C0010G0030 [Candidatus Roizmanbacteria bacterium GW2011_GWC2_37_13]